MNCSIAIKKLAVNVKLGVTDLERLASQEVLIDIDLIFPEIVKGCLSDELKDTLCYKDLSEKITNFCEAHEFKLIEYLAHEILIVIKSYIPANLPVKKINIIIYKKPPIQNLKNCVSFKLSS